MFGILLLIFFLTLQAKDDTVVRSLDGMIATERAFSGRCGAVGVRASFMEYFTDSCIAFNPGPFAYTPFVKTLPPQPNPRAISLVWEPQCAGISASADLGFSSGPSIRKNTTDATVQEYHGMFLSVWRKQDNGEWKVVVDIGVQTPSAVSPMGADVTRILPAPVMNSGDDQFHHEAGNELIRWENDLSARFLNERSSRSMGEMLDPSVQILRENAMPHIGIATVRASFDTARTWMAWTPMRAVASAANDLGYVYGRYVTHHSDTPGDAVDSGYYLHIWRKDDAGKWKLVADCTNADDALK
jgi:ketosteroid isomerase-like protein